VPADADGPMRAERMRLTKPAIAAVAGHAVAGGLELALWCDLRVAEESAMFGVFCRRWGVPLIDGNTIRLPRLIGVSRAMDMILTGRPVGAQEALAMGLANRVVADAASRREAEALARSHSAFSQTCLRKDRLRRSCRLRCPRRRHLATSWRTGCARSPRCSPGSSAFARGRGDTEPFSDQDARRVACV
jgi:enoyl-CoA hydratase